MEQNISNEENDENINNNPIPQNPKIEIKPDYKTFADDLKHFRDNFDKDIHNPSYKDKQKYKSTSTRVRGYLTTITKNGWNSFNAIKTYLSRLVDRNTKNKPADVDADARLIQTILLSKPQGNKILFNSNLFKRPLTSYIFGNRIKTKCLSNDYLYLLYVYNTILKSANYEPIIKNSILNSVKIITDNFRISEDIRKGLIQDYDPLFSVLCTKNITAEDIVNVLKNKTGAGQFTYDGQEFVFYGDEDLSLIKLASVSDKDAVQKFMKMIYLKTEGNKFSEGEKVVPFNAEIRYIDVKLTPEDFCPCFFTTSGKQLDASFLFEFQYDYSTLFNEFAEQGSKGKIKFPKDLFYWNTINQAFDFLSVFAITATQVPFEAREEIAKWCDTYYSLKPYIRKWKETQMLLERIFKDYCSYFLNNSELLRFFNLRDKVLKYLSMEEALYKETNLHSSTKKFFNELPFCRMLTTQFNYDYTAICKKIFRSLSDLIGGVKLPASLRSEIGDIIKIIHTFLPSSDQLDYHFPFIIADGGINGSAENLDKDPLAYGLNKYSEDKNKKETKAKAKAEEDSEKFDERNEKEYKYMKMYIITALANVKLKPGFKVKPYLEKAIGKKVLNKKATEDIKKGAEAFYKLKNYNNFNINSRNQVPFLNSVVNRIIRDWAETQGGFLKEDTIMSPVSSPVESEQEEEKKEEIVITDQKGKKIGSIEKTKSGSIPSKFTLLTKKVTRSKSKGGKAKKKTGYKRDLAFLNKDIDAISSDEDEESN